MVSVTSALRYMATASSYQSRPSMYIRGLITRNWPRQFCLEMAVYPADVEDKRYSLVRCKALSMVCCSRKKTIILSFTGT